ncbi:MAG: helix-turn-helix domain-containing protein [Candidatus Thermoplasmatota archaeon]|nr:helix-turn-helix domain-containing protein [Candidatus Thermoplasmatota archaeon]MCL5793880.1 helix-turn-helix domain-containing protein [Candidatus Thermoplasmatota archaeon]
MEDNRRALSARLSVMMEKEGFRISDHELKGLVSFDLIARRDEDSYVIKVLYNVDTLRGDASEELLSIGHFSNSAAIVIGEKSSSGNLEDGLVYFRHGVPIMTLQTFEDYVRGIKPFVFSGPGGYYVSIDGHEMKKVREKMGLSIGQVSSSVRISRRSVSLYESGSAVTIDIFLKLQDLLAGDLRKEIDIHALSSSYSNHPKIDRMNDRFLESVLSLMGSAGYDATLLRKSPFEAMARDALRSLIFMAFPQSAEADALRARTIMKIAEFMEEEALLVSRSVTDKEMIAGCAVSNINEFIEFCEKGELLSLIEKKKSLA